MNLFFIVKDGVGKMMTLRLGAFFFKPSLDHWRGKGLAKLIDASDPNRFDDADIVGDLGKESAVAEETNGIAVVVKVLVDCSVHL